MDTAGLAERYLELLADDRPTQDLEQLLEEARRDHPDAARTQHLHDLATRVRSLRELGRRRESELVALYETVADLAALKDIDDVLEAIVRRARTLLGADVSYLSLNDDEAGLTYMRVTAGIHTEEFRKVRLGFGEGLGGLVAQTAMPYATADYFADERFEHTGQIDSAVGGEELTAIVGVPLLLGRTVIGVLYAANHTPRPFSREDIDLLSSFAGHAALALDNARQHEEREAAVDGLRQTSDALRVAMAGSQRATAAHDRLFLVVLTGGQLQDVAEVLQDVLDLPVHVVDLSGVMLASGDAEHPPTRDVLAVAAAVGQQDDNRAHVVNGVSVAPVWASESPMAVVVVRGELDDVSLRILERAATTAALLMVVQRSVAETEARLRGDLLADVISSTAGSAALSARASLLGADLSRPQALLVLDGADPARRQVAGDLAALHGGLHTQVGERLVVVLPEVDPLTAGRQVVGRPPEKQPVGRRHATAGVAGPVSGVEGLRAAYREASRCLDALLSLGRRGDVADAAALGFVGLLLGRGDPGLHVQSRLGPVLDYDRARGTRLAETLEVWLAADRHLARTGEQLHVHPNTVSQRLDRIGHLLGDGWQEPDSLLELALALRLRTVLRT